MFTIINKRLIIGHAKQQDVDEYVIPEHIDHISIQCGFIETFVIPEGVEDFIGGCKTLRKVYVPDSVKTLYLDNTCVEELELPNTIKYFSINESYLKVIKFRGGDPVCLDWFEARDNYIERLDFKPPPSLECVDIRNNLITYMHPELQDLFETRPDDFIIR